VTSLAEAVDTMSKLRERARHTPSHDRALVKR
jgi:hypothetical protein